MCVVTRGADPLVVDPRVVVPLVDGVTVWEGDGVIEGCEGAGVDATATGVVVVVEPAWYLL